MDNPLTCVCHYIQTAPYVIAPASSPKPDGESAIAEGGCLRLREGRYPDCSCLLWPFSRSHGCNHGASGHALFPHRCRAWRPEGRCFGAQRWTPHPSSAPCSPLRMIFFFFLILWPHSKLMEVPGPGIESEL